MPRRFAGCINGFLSIVDFLWWIPRFHVSLSEVVNSEGNFTGEEWRLVALRLDELRLVRALLFDLPALTSGSWVGYYA